MAIISRRHADIFLIDYFKLWVKNLNVMRKELDLISQIIKNEVPKLAKNPDIITNLEDTFNSIEKKIKEICVIIMKGNQKNE